MLEPWLLALLFGTGLAAGFVDSIAGGGGLITLPVLLSVFKADPFMVLGTNKLQACFGSGSASWHYARAGAVEVSECGPGFLCSFVGASIGALVVKKLDPHFLRQLLPVLLAAVAIYTWMKPELGAKELHPRMTRAKFDVLFGLGIGFYDGFFGPGTGTFWAMAYMLVLGFNMTRATGYTKVMNFASNLASLVVFLLNGSVHLTAGLAMGLGQLLGARIGSRLVVRRGTKFIRPVFITVVLAITAKLLYDSFWK